MMLKCLIVDDELIARRGIERYVEKIPFLECIGSVRTAADAKHLLEKTDLMILDIQMPQMSGLDFLKGQPHAPLTIVLTAYPEHALEGFELGVIDYIVKPAPFERFLKACTKAKEYIALLRKADDQPKDDYFFIKADRKIEKVFFKDILFIEAKENYCHVHTANGNYMTLVSLSTMESSLDSQLFLRVHKSFIVPVSAIAKMDRNSLWIGLKKIPVSRRIKKALKEKLLHL